MAAKFTRRDMLRLAALAAGGTLAGCAPKIVEVTKVVKETVVQVQEKVVKETVQVEKKVEVTKEVEKKVTVVVDAQAQKKAAMKANMTWTYRADIFQPWPDERVKSFRDMYPDVQIEQIVLARADMYPKEYAMHAAGNLPDICFFYHSHFQLWRAIENGVIMPLDEYVARDQLDLSEWFPLFIDMSKYKGKFYGLPSWGWSGWDCITINSLLLEEAGIKVPDPTSHATTMDTITEWILKFYKPAKAGGPVERFGIDIGIGDISFETLCRAFDGYFISEDGKKCLIGEDENSNKAAKWWYDLAVTNKVTPLSGELAAGDYVAWAEGKLAMFMTGSLGVIFAEQTQKDPKVCKLGNLMFPLRKDGRIPSQMRGGHWNISAKSKFAPQAWEFMKHLSGKDGTIGYNLVSMNGGLVRPDVMPYLKGKSAVYSWFEENLAKGMMIHAPANSRGTELGDAIAQNATRWFDRKSPIPFEEGMKLFHDAVQKVLDMPMG